MKEILQAISEYIKGKKMTYKLFVVCDHEKMYCMYESTFGGKQIDVLSELPFTNIPEFKTVLEWVDRIIEKPYEYGV